MAEHPFMPLWTDAYLGDTTHLSTIEHGAYLLLLMTMWRAGGDLPNDDKMLARYARLTTGQWRRIKPVLMPFFRVRDGRLTQGRLTDELEAVRQHSKRQSDRAKARWLKNNETGDAAAMPERCNHTHTHREPNGSPPFSPPKPEKPDKPAKRKTRLPDDWQPDDALIAWATDQGLSRQEVDRETDQFRDHWHAKGETRLDWRASFRTWVRNAKRWRKPARKPDDDWRERDARRRRDWLGEDVGGCPADNREPVPDEGSGTVDLEPDGGQVWREKGPRRRDASGFRGVSQPTDPVSGGSRRSGFERMDGPVPPNPWGAEGGLSELDEPAAREAPAAPVGCFAVGSGGLAGASGPGREVGQGGPLAGERGLDFGDCCGGACQPWRSTARH